MATLINGLGGDAGFGELTLSRNDDGSSAPIDITAIFEDGLNFGGEIFTEIFVNTNGNITFETPLSTFTPFGIVESTIPIIAAFFADVDTRGGPVETPTPGGVSQGTNLIYVDIDPEADVVTITWDDVGFFSNDTSLLNAFQIQLIDTGGGDFDIRFLYEDINWTTGDASGGVDGLGGTPARIGFSAGDGVTFDELGASGDENALLALETTDFGAGPGVVAFSVTGGQAGPLPDDFAPPTGFFISRDALAFELLDGGAATGETVSAPATGVAGALAAAGAGFDVSSVSGDVTATTERGLGVAGAGDGALLAQVIDNGESLTVGLTPGAEGDDDADGVTLRFESLSFPNPLSDFAAITFTGPGGVTETIGVGAFDVIAVGRGAFEVTLAPAFAFNEVSVAAAEGATFALRRADFAGFDPAPPPPPPPVVAFEDTFLADDLVGTDADETIVLLDDGQPDIFDAAGGVDTIDLSSLTSSSFQLIIVDLMTGSLTSSSTGSDSVSNFEAIIGTDAFNQNFRDVFIGSGEAEIFDVTTSRNVRFLATSGGTFTSPDMGGQAIFPEHDLVFDGDGADTVTSLNDVAVRLSADGISEVSLIANSRRAILDFADAPEGIIVDLRNQSSEGGAADALVIDSDTIGDQAAETVSGFGSIGGSPFDDELTGFGVVFDGAGADIVRIGATSSGGERLIVLDIDQTTEQLIEAIGGGGVLSLTLADAPVNVDLANQGVSGALVLSGGGFGDQNGETVLGFSDIEATQFDDIIFGDDESNFFRSGNGVDRIDGRGGDDRFDDFASAGGDILTGGAGADIFEYQFFIPSMFSAGLDELDGVDLITDFSSVEGDRFDVGAGVSRQGDVAFTPGLAALTTGDVAVAGFFAGSAGGDATDGAVVEDDGVNSRIFLDFDRDGDYTPGADGVVNLNGTIASTGVTAAQFTNFDGSITLQAAQDAPPPPAAGAFIDTPAADFGVGTDADETITLLDDGQFDVFDGAGGFDTAIIDAVTTPGALIVGLQGETATLGLALPGVGPAEVLSADFGDEESNDTFLNVENFIAGGPGSGATLSVQLFTGDTIVDLTADNQIVSTDSEGSAPSVSGFDGVVGSFFNDEITGDDGDNALAGSGGADTLTGGGGADTFLFLSTGGSAIDSNALNADFITDFNAGEGDVVQFIDAVDDLDVSDSPILEPGVVLEFPIPSFVAGFFSSREATGGVVIQDDPDFITGLGPDGVTRVFIDLDADGDFTAIDAVVDFAGTIATTGLDQPGAIVFEDAAAAVGTIVDTLANDTGTAVGTAADDTLFLIIDGNDVDANGFEIFDGGGGFDTASSVAFIGPTSAIFAQDFEGGLGPIIGITENFDAEEDGGDFIDDPSAIINVLLNFERIEAGPGLQDTLFFDFETISDDLAINLGAANQLVDGGPLFAGVEATGFENAVGGSGDDDILGDDGDNILSGALGFDQLQGFGGADAFVFEDGEDSGVTSFGVDLIVDFDASEGDTIRGFGPLALGVTGPVVTETDPFNSALPVGTSVAGFFASRGATNGVVIQDSTTDSLTRVLIDLDGNGDLGGFDIVIDFDGGVAITGIDEGVFEDFGFSPSSFLVAAPEFGRLLATAARLSPEAEAFLTASAKASVRFQHDATDDVAVASYADMSEDVLL